MASASSQARDEDAATLNLGPDFQDGRCLLNSEVAIILQHKLEQMRADGKRPPSNDFLKAHEYVNRVKQFKDKDTIAQIRQELENYTPYEFEVAQLGNLCPEDAEEAKALVPSLALAGRDDVDDAQLTEFLQQLVTRRQLT